MLKYSLLLEGIGRFKSLSGDKIKAIYYEPKYLKDLSLDIEYSIDPYAWPRKRTNPIIPENRKNIMIYGFPGYMRELGFYGFSIHGEKKLMCYHVNERKEFFTNL